MNPESVAALVKTLGGGGTTGIMVLLVLWFYNKRNGNVKYVSEGVCKLHQKSLQKDIACMQKTVDRVEQLVRNGQKGVG